MLAEDRALRGGRPRLRPLQYGRLRGPRRGHLRRDRRRLPSCCASTARPSIPTGITPRDEVAARQTATSIATGGMLPRGADCRGARGAVTDLERRRRRSWCAVRRCPAARWSRSPAPTSGAGETVLFAAERGSAPARPACWRPSAAPRSRCVRRPRVAILSTGDEIVQPGEAHAPRPGLRQQRPHPGRRRA